MRYRCRCRRRACQVRVTLARHPDAYRRERRCRACGSGLRVDRYRTEGDEARRDTCRCDGLPFPHRRGSYTYERGLGGPTACRRATISDDELFEE